MPDYFPKHPEANPKIYAYQILGADNRTGLLKVGFTNREVKTRIKEQLGTAGLEYKIVLEQSAMRTDGTNFGDSQVHTQLKTKGFINPDGEWFRCKVGDVKSAI